MNKFMCAVLGVGCGIMLTLGVVTNQSVKNMWEDRQYHKSQEKIKDDLIDIINNTKALPYEYTVNQKVYWNDKIKSLSLHKHQDDGKIYVGLAHTQSDIVNADNREEAGYCSWEVAEVHLHPEDNNGYLYSGVTHVEGECKLLHTHDDNSLCAEEHSDPVADGVIELKTHTHDNGEIHTGPSHTENNLLESQLISEATYDGRIDPLNGIMYELLNSESDIIHAINIDGISYVNDGIFLQDDKYVQTELGFNRVEYIKTAWFDYLPYIINNMSIDLYNEGNSYYIKLVSPMDVYTLTGFSQMPNETERILEIIVNVDKDGLISSLNQGLTIITDDGISTMTVEIPEMNRSQSISNLKWHGLEYTKDKELKFLEDLELVEVPETLGELPYGASPLVVQIAQGIVVPYMPLEDEFYKELYDKAIDVEGSDIYKVGYTEYDDGGSLFYVLNTTGKYIESLIYDGLFMTENMHSQMPIQRLDKYRLAPNYVSDGKDGSSIRTYVGEVLGKRYTVRLKGSSLGFTQIKEYSEDTKKIIDDFETYKAKLTGEASNKEDNK